MRHVRQKSIRSAQSFALDNATPICPCDGIAKPFWRAAPLTEMMHA